jgi:nitrogen fixation protein NifQ
MYDRLCAEGKGNDFDRHVFACAITIGLKESGRPLTHALGLDRSMLSELCERYFPDSALTIDALAVDDAGPDAIEEPDLRELLLEYRTRGIEEESWMAAIVARRSLLANHLWQDLGLFKRAELSALLLKYFAPLACRNTHDMKWKKFFYRELCQRDGIFVCKAPNCEVCSDFEHCFGGEEGEPLSALQRPLSQT